MEDNKEKRIGFEIKKTSNLIKSKFAEIIQSTYQESDFPEQYCWILGYLYRHRDRVIIQKDIEQAFCVCRATMSKTITCLENKGYIERKEVQGDKRINQIALTEKGLEQESKVRNSIAIFEKQLSSNLTDEEKQQLFSVLNKITNILKEEN